MLEGQRLSVRTHAGLIEHEFARHGGGDADALFGEPLAEVLEVGAVVAGVLHLLRDGLRSAWGLLRLRGVFLCGSLLRRGAGTIRDGDFPELRQLLRADRLAERFADPLFMLACHLLCELGNAGLHSVEVRHGELEETVALRVRERHGVHAVLTAHLCEQGRVLCAAERHADRLAGGCGLRLGLCLGRVHAVFDEPLPGPLLRISLVVREETAHSIPDCASKKSENPLSYIVAHILCHVVPSFLPPGRAYWVAVSLPSYPWHLLSRQPHSLHDAECVCCQWGMKMAPIRRPGPQAEIGLCDGIYGLRMRFQPPPDKKDTTGNGGLTGFMVDIKIPRRWKTLGGEFHERRG